MMRSRFDRARRGDQLSRVYNSATKTYKEAVGFYDVGRDLLRDAKRPNRYSSDAIQAMRHWIDEMEEISADLIGLRRALNDEMVTERLNNPALVNSKTWRSMSALMNDMTDLDASMWSLEGQMNVYEVY